MEGVPALPVVYFTSALGDDGATDDEWLGECVHRVSQTPQVLIDHIVREEDGRLLLCLDAVDEALEPGFAAALCRSTVGLLNGLADPDGWLDPAWAAIPLATCRCREFRRPSAVRAVGSTTRCGWWRRGRPLQFWPGVLRCLMEQRHAVQRRWQKSWCAGASSRVDPS